MARRETTLEPGALIALTSARTFRTSRCTIGDLIGVGGSAKVYAGILDDGSHVVVKAQRWADASDAAFEREILLSKQVLHRNVVHCVGAGVLPRGQLALGFRRAYPNPLLLLASAPGAQPRLPLDVAIDLSYELLNALDYLERIGVVHHDVKHGNLLIDVAPGERLLEDHEVLERIARREYRAVLIDFGAARFREELGAWRQGDQHPDGLTPELTPFYAPPEAVLETRGPGGQLERTFHPSLDLYAAALVIHALVTGRVPYSHLPTPPDPTDMESLVGVKSAERRGELRPVSDEDLSAVVFADTEFLVGDREAFDWGFSRFLERRLHPDPGRRGTAADMKRDFARLMRIRAQRRSGPGARSVALPFVQELVRVGEEGRAGLALGGREPLASQEPSTEVFVLRPRPTTRRRRRHADKEPTNRIPRPPGSEPELTPLAPFPTGQEATRGPLDPSERDHPAKARARAPHCLVSAVLDEPVLLERDHAYLVGRSPRAHIRIRSDRVSRRHASVRWEGEAFVLREEGSMNGTLLNGYRLTKPCALHEGDRISFAGFQFVVRVLGVDGSADTGFDQPDLAGNLGELELLAAFDLLDWKRRTGTLTIATTASDPKGRLIVEEGKIVNAEGLGARGLEAAVRLLAERSGQFSFAPGAAAGPRTIDCPRHELWGMVQRRLQQG